MNGFRTLIQNTTPRGRAVMAASVVGTIVLAFFLMKVAGAPAYEVGPRSVVLVAPGAGRAEALGLLARIQAASGATGTAVELEPDEDAVALLTRQALEQTLDDLWRWKAPGTQLASRRAQLLCLGPYIGDEALAQEVRYAWVALSRACHHHPYEVGAGAEELARVASTERVTVALRSENSIVTWSSPASVSTPFSPGSRPDSLR